MRTRLVIHLSIPLLGLAFVSFGTELQAQATGGPHPHVAPKVPGLNLSGRLNPRFNEPDGLWNYGEGFEGGLPTFDHGGIHGKPRGLPSLPDIHTSVNWSPDPNYQAHVLKGYLAPPQAAANPIEAAFSISIPNDLYSGNYDPERPIVLVVATHSTQRDGIVGDQHSYMGAGFPHGLTDWPSPNGPMLSERSLAPQFPAYVVGAYIVPRVGHRPLFFTLQRQLELVETVRLVLQRDFDLSYDAVMIGGGSFGGMTTHLATLFYPDVFHAGLSAAFSTGMRRVSGDQEFHRLVASLSAFAGVDGYTPLDEFMMPGWMNQEGTNFEQSSPSVRFAAGECFRPIYYLMTDEDPVTHGDDTIPIFSQTIGTPVPDHGTAMQTTSARIQSLYPTLQSVNIHWTIVDKRGHEGPRGQTVSLPDGTPITGPDFFERAAEWLIPEALAASALPVSRADVLAQGVPNNLVTVDPHDHALVSRVAEADPPINPGYLKDPPIGTWTRRGAGTWLGVSESMVMGRPHPQDAVSIYVGSADGVVTRFAVDSGSTALVQIAQTPDLGYGVWSLALGDVEPGVDLELVALTHRGIGIFRADNLALIRGTTFTDWEFTEPQKVHITDLDDDGEVEIVFLTEGGRLVALDRQLNVLANYPEPGIRDLIPSTEIIPGYGRYHHPIHLLSSRGGIYNILLTDDPLNPAYLTAASVPLTGNLVDLERIQWNGAPALAAVLPGKPNSGVVPPLIEVFDPTTLDLIGAFAHTQDAANGAVDLVIASDGSADYFVLLFGSWIRIFDSGGTFIADTDLSDYAPADSAFAIRAGDLDPTYLGDEIVISTKNGHVVWFLLSDLLAGTISNPEDGFSHINETLAATWGLTYAEDNLQVVDQTGTRWSIDPLTGTPSFRGVMKDTAPLPWIENGAAFPVRPGPHRGPFRDLVYVPSEGPLQGAPVSIIPNTLSGYRLRTEPYSYAPFTSGFLWLNHPGASPFIDINSYLYSFSGYIALPGSGDLFGVHENRQDLFTWGGEFSPHHERNVVVGLSFEDLGSATQVTSAWQSLTNVVANSPIPDLDLRNNGRLDDVHDVQSLRMGRIRSAETYEVAASTLGGSVLLLDPTDPTTILAESEDFGFGGMALAVADLDYPPDGRDEIIFGTLIDPITPDSSPLYGWIHILSWNGNDLVEQSRFPIGYGVSGIAIADIDPEYVGPELVATTLEGDLAVLDLDSAGRFTNVVLHRRGFAGAVGNYNSIHVGDHVDLSVDPPVRGSDGRMEIYFAGSMGVRRLDF